MTQEPRRWSFVANAQKCKDTMKNGFEFEKFVVQYIVQYSVGFRVSELDCCNTFALSAFNEAFGE